MAATETSIHAVTEMAKRMRIEAVELAYKAGRNGAHLGGGLSAIEILASLYGYAMRFSKDLLSQPNHDRFVLSKGHGTLAYYPALFEAGLISKEQLYSFEENGGAFPGQPVYNPALGIETASGSLGMGLSIGVGMALAAKMRNLDYRVFVLLGDGECNEGSVWEAVMSAVHFGLTNIVVIIDQNNLQSDGACSEVLKTAPLMEMWEGFGWNTCSIDGHSASALCGAFDACTEKDLPCAVFAKTVKGKGVSFMENNRAWHHGVLSKSQYEQALSEVRGD